MGQACILLNQVITDHIFTIPNKTKFTGTMGQYPWHSLLRIEEKSATPVYLQIANAIIKEIQVGRMKPGTKLPGVLVTGNILKVNKKTIEKVYSELSLQRWITVTPKVGSFVSEDLPDIDNKVLQSPGGPGIAEKPHFNLQKKGLFQLPVLQRGNEIVFNDGFPDSRLIDHALVSRTYRSIINLKSYRSLLSYSCSYGDGVLREVLAKYLNETRGIRCRAENVMITRGSQMALYISMMLLLGKGDVSVVSDPNYFFADQTLSYLQSEIHKVTVDNNGINVDEVEALCKKRSVRLVYLTPHHHHPTTVTLSAARRMQLLRLAEKYRFAIIEDDYDFDFHYCHHPILPLASVDTKGSVIYIGSFSKTVSPAFRIGYMVAPGKFIDEAASLRKIIDFQGDTILERTMAQLIDQGELQRMIRKSLKEYGKRRDYLSDLLANELPGLVTFDKPGGGMAIWATFAQSVKLDKLSETAKKQNVSISDGRPYGNNNSLRLGFASLNPSEMDEGIMVLRNLLINDL